MIAQIEQHLLQVAGVAQGRQLGVCLQRNGNFAVEGVAADIDYFLGYFVDIDWFAGGGFSVVGVDHELVDDIGGALG